MTAIMDAVKIPCVALGLLLLAGCSSPVVAPSVDQRTPSQPSATAALMMGETATFPDVSLTVLDAHSGSSRARGAYLSALIRTCVAANDAGLSWSPWLAIGPDGERYPASSETYSSDPLPTYPFDGEQTFHPGQCAKGWVVFGVPSGARVSSLRYQNDSGQEAEWVV